MDEITFQVQRDEPSGWFVASWNAPEGLGGITTQVEDLGDLETQILEAVVTHFDEHEIPRRIRLHSWMTEFELQPFDL